MTTRKQFPLWPILWVTFVPFLTGFALLITGDQGGRRAAFLELGFCLFVWVILGLLYAGFRLGSRP